MKFITTKNAKGRERIKNTEKSKQIININSDEVSNTNQSHVGVKKVLAILGKIKIHGSPDYLYQIDVHENSRRNVFFFIV